MSTPPDQPPDQPSEQPSDQDPAGSPQPNPTGWLPPYQQYRDDIPPQPAAGPAEYAPGSYADPMAPFGYDPTGRPYSDKLKLVAGLLGIFFGGFGVGRFYTGHTNIGLAQLAVTIVTIGFGALWGLIDGVLILVNGGTDAHGRPLRD